MKLLLLGQFESIYLMINNPKKSQELDFAKKFNKNEKKIDVFELKLSENLVQTIGLEQPMAKDLRMLISYFRMINHLERIGDQLCNVYENISMITNYDSYDSIVDMVKEMLYDSEQMVRKSLIAFDDEDKDYALWTIRRDSKIDLKQKTILKKIINYKNQELLDESNLYNIIWFNNIINAIERIADNSTNIAEVAIYFLEGIDLRHKLIDEEFEI
jgi:phosphate transport system protein